MAALAISFEACLGGGWLEGLSGEWPTLVMSCGTLTGASEVVAFFISDLIFWTLDFQSLAGDFMMSNRRLLRRIRARRVKRMPTELPIYTPTTISSVNRAKEAQRQYHN
jgi:hypothetical protein